MEYPGPNGFHSKLIFFFPRFDQIQPGSRPGKLLCTSLALANRGAHRSTSALSGRPASENWVTLGQPKFIRSMETHDHFSPRIFSGYPIYNIVSDKLRLCGMHLGFQGGPGKPCEFETKGIIYLADWFAIDALSTLAQTGGSVAFLDWWQHNYGPLKTVHLQVKGNYPLVN